MNRLDDRKRRSNSRRKGAKWYYNIYTKPKYAYYDYKLLL